MTDLCPPGVTSGVLGGLFQGNKHDNFYNQKERFHNHARDQTEHLTGLVFAYDNFHNCTQTFFQIDTYDLPQIWNERFR